MGWSLQGRIGWRQQSPEGRSVQLRETGQIIRVSACTGSDMVREQGEGEGGGCTVGVAASRCDRGSDTCQFRRGLAASDWRPDSGPDRRACIVVGSLHPPKARIAM